jgi:hypothetical protein
MTATYSTLFLGTAHLPLVGSQPTRFAVIGEVFKTGSGNTVLRVGKTVGDKAWEQTAYVVLTPDEVEMLKKALDRGFDQ